MPPKNRQRYSLEEKQWLRQYASTNPSVGKACIAFKEKFNKTIPQSTASGIIDTDKPLCGSASTSGLSSISAIQVDPVEAIGRQSIGYAEVCKATGQGQSSLDLGDGPHSPRASSQFQASAHEPLVVAISANSAGMMGQVALDNIPEQTILQAYSAEQSEFWMAAHQEKALVFQDQHQQAEPVRSSSNPNSPKDWMQFLNLSREPSPLEQSLNDRPLITGRHRSPLPCPTMKSPSPGNDTPQNPLIHGKESLANTHQEPPRKRRRMRAGPANVNIDITESIDTLQSLHEASATTLRSPAVNIVCGALRKILAFTTQEYQRELNKNKSLFRILMNALRNSPSVIVGKARMSPAERSTSAYQFSELQNTNQQQRQSGVVYSCQSACARIDLIVRKRIPGANSGMNRSGVLLGDLSSENARGKQPAREGNGSSIEADENAEECFIGKVVITPTAGKAQFSFSIAQKTSLCSNSFLAPRISIRLTIPSSSEIFKVAAFGTLSQLQEILQNGIAYWNVCDENGVSLIHYAARALNLEIGQFLLDLQDDVDAVEPNKICFDGESQVSMLTHRSEIMLSMFDFPNRNFRMCDHETKNKVTAWRRMVLRKGADPLLHTFTSPNNCGQSIFKNVLWCGSLETVIDILNYGAPFVSVTSMTSVDRIYNECALLRASRNFRYPGIDTVDKVLEILRRGADATVRDEQDRTCLHLILGYLNIRSMFYRPIYSKPRKEDVEKVLIALINAGADVSACDAKGISVSLEAYRFRRIKLWIRVLKKCDYNPWDILGKGGLELITGNSDEVESVWKIGTETGKDVGVHEDEEDGED